MNRTAESYASSAVKLEIGRLFKQAGSRTAQARKKKMAKKARDKPTIATGRQISQRPNLLLEQKRQITPEPMEIRQVRPPAAKAKRGRME